MSIESFRTPHGSTITQFPGNGKPVSPSDTVTYEEGLALYVGGEGDVEVVTVDNDQTVMFSAFPAGAVLPVRVKKITANTTATNLVGVW